MLVGSFASAAAMAPAGRQFFQVETGVFTIDVFMLLVFLSLVFLTDRFWPIWATAFQLLGVLSHFAKLLYPPMLENGYGVLLAMWSYPVLIVLALGARMHQRLKRRVATVS